MGKNTTAPADSRPRHSMRVNGKCENLGHRIQTIHVVKGDDMQPADYCDSNLTTTLTALEAGTLTSEALTQALLDRIAERNPAINAVVTMQAESALARARQADHDRAAGQVWGPLHGIPMTIKDGFEVLGMVTASGSPSLKQYQPKENAVAVQRLIDAGAIIVGKTNVPLYCGDFQSYNAVYGTTNNPWDTSRSPGGSSGGAAAALASGMTLAELGSDIGGSIRNPAHFCGVYGHKPSQGIVPTRGHIPGPPGTKGQTDMVVAGPMARSAADLRLLLDVLAGPDALDDEGWQLDLPDCRWEADEFRVLCWFDDPTCPIDTGYRTQLRNAASALRGMGATVTDTPPDELQLSQYYPLYMRLLAGVMGGGLPANPFKQMQWAARIGKLTGKTRPDTVPGYAAAATQSHREWLRDNELRHRLRHQWQTLFESYDVVLMPVTPTAAMPHQQAGNLFKRRIQVDGVSRPYADNMAWVAPATLLHLPATVAPIGVADNLPVGVQIVGPYLHDKRTIRAAELLQQTIDQVA